MRTLLIDADILAYRAAAAGEVSVDWDGDGDKTQSPEDFSEIMKRCDQAVQNLKDKLAATAVLICLSCPSHANWRREVLPSYKMNRANNVRPIHLQRAKDYLATGYPSLLWDRLEADDVMGIISTDPKGIGDRIIVSEDKDMQTIPGLLFNPDKDSYVRVITEDDANWFHMYQTLTGDTVDGYKGAPGIGDVKARNILEEADTPARRWEAVVLCYLQAMRKKNNEVNREEAFKAALVQARVARILHHSDYSRKSRIVTLWKPPSCSSGQ
jgi:DNA polymerase-1